MNKNILLGCLLSLLVWSTMQSQGFTSPALQWNIPIVTDNSDYRVSYDYHQVIDMDGDGKMDLVDTENHATESISDVFLNGNQKYWKVYLGNGAGFSATAVQWNIPIDFDTTEYRLAWDYHTLIDMNGDNKPDFVDTENQATGTADTFLNGNQKYWKVYLNTGSGFSATATQWNIPIVSDTSDYRLAWEYHTLIDMDGDLKPDFVDTENEATSNTFETFLNGNQKYWKVYLNTGSGFSATASQWNIPVNTDTSDYHLAWDYHTLIDMDGDMKPDYVDTENEATSNTSDTFLNGNQKYWKVYLNTGSGFNASAVQWNIPVMTDTSEYRLYWDYHTVIDMNGDKKPDFVDTENHSTESVSDVFLNGSQKYWKVYLSTGSGFAAAATQWNIPVNTDTSDYRISWDYHTVIDMNGDLKPDFVDSENEGTNSISDVFLNGNQKYWKVYLNNAPGGLGTQGFVSSGIGLYPNPVKNSFKVGQNIPLTSLTIYDIQGAVVRTMTADFDRDIDVSDLAKGIYVVKAMTTAGGILTQRIIKE